MIPVCSTVYTHHKGDILPGLFFLPAECNLFEYMTKADVQTPASDGERLRNMQQMIEICRALVWLHRNLEYVDGDDEYKVTEFYHCDLSPANILVCKQPSSTSVVFKLSDFGQARGLRESSIAGGGKNRKLGSVIQLPGRSQYTYLPPECQDPVSQASTAHSTTDVWSFGCILLLMILFNYEGPGNVKGFQQERLDHSVRTGSGKVDRFFCKSTKQVPIMNPAVKETMHRLAGRTRNVEKVGESDNAFTQSTLKYLGEHVLVINHKDRNKISKVLEKLQTYYNQRPTIPMNSIKRHVDLDNLNPLGWSNFPDGKAFVYSEEALQIYEQDAADAKRTLRKTLEKWSSLKSLRPSMRHCSKTGVCIVSNEREKTCARVSASRMDVIIAANADVLPLVCHCVPVRCR